MPTPPVSAHDVAGGCCAAGFQSDLCPLWVIFVRPTRFRGSRHVRFAPKADNDRRDGYVHFVPSADIAPCVDFVRFTPKSGQTGDVAECPLCAKSGLMQCSKKDRYSIASSARASSVGGTSKPTLQFAGQAPCLGALPTIRKRILGS